MMRKVVQKFEFKIDFLLIKLINLLNSFQFNVAIALFYEIYKYFNDSVKIRNR